jgi:hypothetical protein
MTTDTGERFFCIEAQARIPTEQQRLSKPVKFPENRKEFWDKYRKLGSEDYLKLYK